MEMEEYARITENAEMSVSEHALILALIKKMQPKKLVEVGVCSGGTTNLLLKNLPATAELFSIDIQENYARDSSKKTGYVAEADYDPASQARWVRHFGKDAADCAEEIGPGIDFVILDTVHSMPGEFLSLLSLYPFMAEQSVLVLHDIGIHAIYKITKQDEKVSEQRQYCTPLLFGALEATRRIYTEDAIPNCGALILDKQQGAQNLQLLFNMLFMDWEYMPDARIIASTLKIVKKYYTRTYVEMFCEALSYNQKRLPA